MTDFKVDLKNTGTLSERISVLLEAADQLRVEIRKLRREINERECVESINHLADVPGDMLDALFVLEKHVKAASELTAAITAIHYPAVPLDGHIEAKQ